MRLLSACSPASGSSTLRVTQRRTGPVMAPLPWVRTRVMLSIFPILSRSCAYTGLASSNRCVFGRWSLRSENPPADDAVRPENLSIRMNSLTQKWLPSIRKRKLAGIVEFTLNESPEASELDATREPAAAAAALGYSIRIRSSAPLNREAREFVLYRARSLSSRPQRLPEIPAACRWKPVAFTFSRRSRPFATIVITQRRSAMRWNRVRRLPSVRATGWKKTPHSIRNSCSMSRAGVLGCQSKKRLQATTYNAACSLRMSHVTGSLEPGKSADVLVMDAHDYRDLARRPGHSDVHSVYAPAIWFFSADRCSKLRQRILKQRTFVRDAGRAGSAPGGGRSAHAA